ncbi:helix-turn-helix domain-containing protein [Sorangium sp. So ce887]|uniref:helix-turn-helix domain-containing protein n=1 Tax=Sorangium sp. So ce887 TaxID=3133324 RepID=UPI003F5F93CC
MHGLDWDAFRVLLAVVERGSFSAGARALGISQPTAGRKIAELEGALGARLLVRRSRGVLPTPAGEEILAEGEIENVSLARQGRVDQPAIPATALPQMPWPSSTPRTPLNPR